MAQNESTPKQNPEAPGYAVGYGKPPLHTRFRKGRSGNPLGRPKRATDLASLLTRALDRRVTSDDRDAGTQREAIIAALVEKSAAGDLRATKLLFELMRQIGPAAPAPGSIAPEDDPRESCSGGSPGLPGIAASPEWSKRLGLWSAGRFQRERREIAVADQTDAEIGDAPPHRRAQQRGQLIFVPIARHRFRQRRARAARRMEIEFAVPRRQMRQQPQNPFLDHRAAPGDAEDMIVRRQPGPAQPPPQRRDRRLIERHPVALAGEGGAQRRRRLGGQADGAHAVIAADLDESRAIVGCRCMCLCALTWSSASPVARNASNWARISAASRARMPGAKKYRSAARSLIAVEAAVLPRQRAEFGGRQDRLAVDQDEVQPDPQPRQTARPESRRRRPPGRRPSGSRRSGFRRGRLSRPPR